MSTCGKCGGTRWFRYLGPDGTSDTCTTCGHPRQGDAARIHRLLNIGRLPAYKSNTCHRCEAAVRDAVICKTCARDVERSLAEVPWLTQQLEVTIARLTKFQEEADKTTGSPTPPVGFMPEAAEARDNMRAVFVSWCLLYADEYGTVVETSGPHCGACVHPSCAEMRKWNNRPRVADTLEAMSRFLLPKVEHFRHHDLALSFVDEITHTVARCHAAVDTPPRPGIFVGPCIEDDCPGEMTAYLPRRDDGEAFMSCGECDKVWATVEWSKVSKRLEQLSKAATDESGTDEGRGDSCPSECADHQPVGA